MVFFEDGKVTQGMEVWPVTEHPYTVTAPSGLVSDSTRLGSSTYTGPAFNRAEYEICQRRGHDGTGSWTFNFAGEVSIGRCKWCGMSLRREPPQPARIVEVGEPSEE